MTDDIVKRLHGYPEIDECAEAADKIERLRAELAAERELREKYMRKSLERTKERDRLREALVKAHNAIRDLCLDDAHDAIDAVLEETKGG